MQKFLTGKNLIIAIVALVVVLVLLISIPAAYDAFYSEKVTGGVKLNAISLSGKTRDEVSAVLDEEIAKPKEIFISVADQQITLDLNSAGFRIDKEATLESICKTGKNNFWQALKARLFRTSVPATVISDREMFHTVMETLLTEKNLNDQKFTYTVDGTVAEITLTPDVVCYDTQKLFDQILAEYPVISESYVMEQMSAEAPTVAEISSVINVPVVDAKLEKVDGKNKIIPHQIGLAVDEEVLAQMLESGEAVFQVPVTVLKPKVYVDDLSEDAFPNRLSTFTTYYNEGEVSRSSNVKLAAKKVNGTVLNCGDVFSFNQVVGKRSYENGFKDAKIFLSDKVVDGTGGGICQVSSTIYPAVLYSDLKIVERRNHNFVVSYAKSGVDATVVYGSIDFKFQNNLQNPIRIKATAVNGAMTVEIWGTKENNNTVEISTQHLGSTPRGVKYEYNEALQPGEEKVTQAGYDGVKVQTYRTVKDANGTVIRTDNLGVSNYIPLVKIIQTSDQGLVETGIPTEALPEESPAPSDDPNATPAPDATPDASATPSPETAVTPAPQVTPAPEPTPTAEATPQPTQAPVATPDPGLSSNE